MKYLNNVLTVDVGLQSPTGWAYWRGTKYPETGEIKCPSYKLRNNHAARGYICRRFEYLLHTRFPRKMGCVYLEGTLMYRSTAGQAAIRKGGLFELAYLVGGLEHCCSKLECHIINAREWKGQMTKKMTAAKIKMINDLEYPSEHITDSVGMGFGLMGAFEWEIRKK